MARSPNYPAITLPQAIDDAKSVWQKHQRSTIAPIEAAQTLGFKGLSGASRPRLAALKKYGVLEKRGKGLALSDRGISFAVRQADSGLYADAVRGAIMDVSLFANLLRTHRDASRRMILEHLIADLSFTEDGAGRATEAFVAAKELLDSLGSAGTVDGNSPDPNKDPDSEKVTPGVFVQWVSQGAVRFAVPRKVVRIKEHDDGEMYACVVDEKGQEGWAKVSELVVEPEAVDAGTGTSPPPPPPPAPPPSGGADVGSGKQATMPLDSGGRVTIEWPDSLTAEDYEDIKAWLAILGPKIGRSVKPDDSGD